MTYYQGHSALCTPRGTIFYDSNGKPYEVEEKLSNSSADKELFTDAIRRVTGVQPKGNHDQQDHRGGA